jgi:hypothetical protein
VYIRMIFMLSILDDALLRSRTLEAPVGS